MNYYDDLRMAQHKEEERQAENDKRIAKYFEGTLKPSNKKIIRKLKEEVRI